MDQLTLWKEIIALEGQEFTTSGRGTTPGVPFSYKVSRQGGRGGRHYEGPEVPGYGNEIWISTKDGAKKKSISRSTVEKAYARALELDGVVPGPKKLEVPGAASYLYPVFVKLKVKQSPIS